MFYISSRGSSANTWLAKVLSRHPKIVCFRSSRSFPPVAPGDKILGSIFPINEVSPEFFIQGLLECERASENEKIFGSIHGYHGTIAKKACEDEGGYFSYITRHPIDRIHSALIYYLDKEFYNIHKIHIKNKDINRHISELFNSKENIQYLDSLNKKNASNSFEKYNRFKETLKHLFPAKIIEILKSFKKVSRSFTKVKIKKYNSDSKFNEITHIYNLMSELLDSFFSYERDLIYNCPNSLGIKMEEMVSSPIYFKEKILSKIIPSSSINGNFINEIFAEKRHGIHRDNPLGTKEIWESWPDTLKDLFLKKYNFYGIKKCTSIWDYDMSFI